jgi:hypothetical protein
MKTGEARKKLDDIVETVEAIEIFEKGRRRAAAAIAVAAALLAAATMMSHRMHTEGVIVEGERNTQWANYDRKRSVEHMYEADATIAALLKGGETATAEFNKRAIIEIKGEGDKKLGTEKIKIAAENLDHELKNVQHRASTYDIAELLLEMSIVLCSFSILQDSKILYKGSKIATALGAFVFLYGFLLIQWPGLYPDKIFP